MVRFFTRLLGALLLATAAFADPMPPASAGSGSSQFTPVGAERAGNAAGTIPSWDGGITEPVSGYTPGDHHPDPYADDPIEFTINAANQKM
jgi:hypothetical protein